MYLHADTYIWSKRYKYAINMLIIRLNSSRFINDPIIDNGEYRIRSNREIYQMYPKLNIKSFIRGKRLEWAGHAWRSVGYNKRCNE